MIGGGQGWLLEEVPFELTFDGCVRRNGSGERVGTGLCSILAKNLDFTQQSLGNL